MPLAPPVTTADLPLRSYLTGMLCPLWMSACICSASGQNRPVSFPALSRSADHVRVRPRRVSARIAARRLTSYVVEEAPMRDHGLDGLDIFRGVVDGIRRVHAPRQPA